MVPEATDGHTACVIDGCMYVFGGFQDSTNLFAQDVYMLDLNTLEWSFVETQVYTLL